VQSIGEFFIRFFVADLHQSFAIKARASRAWLECLASRKNAPQMTQMILKVESPRK
jgi:DNA-binding GntR family transcriptional regulator